MRQVRSLIAKTTKKGLFEIADGGTLFLDEIGECPSRSGKAPPGHRDQDPSGGSAATRDIKVDVRVIAATNKDLGECAKEGSFRRISITFQCNAHQHTPLRKGLRISYARRVFLLILQRI